MGMHDQTTTKKRDVARLFLRWEIFLDKLKSVWGLNPMFHCHVPNAPTHYSRYKANVDVSNKLIKENHMDETNGQNKRLTNTYQYHGNLKNVAL